MLNCNNIWLRCIEWSRITPCMTQTVCCAMIDIMVRIHDKLCGIFPSVPSTIGNGSAENSMLCQYKCNQALDQDLDILISQSQECWLVILLCQTWSKQSQHHMEHRWSLYSRIEVLESNYPLPLPHPHHDYNHYHLYYHTPPTPAITPYHNFQWHT
jgi:hypothetical protein